MRHVLTVFLLISVFLSLSPSHADGAHSEAFNPYTMYFALGKPPKGLSGFQVFGLNRGAPGAGGSKIDGWVMTDRSDPDGSVIDVKKVTLDGKHLTFTSESRRGLVFAFDGRFLQGGDITRFSGKQVPVVEGTVRRLINGKKTAEGKMRFYCNDRAN
jgi:hypothetical protein